MILDVKMRKFKWNTKNIQRSEKAKEQKRKYENKRKCNKVQKRRHNKAKKLKYKKAKREKSSNNRRKYDKFYVNLSSFPFLKSSIRTSQTLRRRLHKQKVMWRVLGLLPYHIFFHDSRYKCRETLIKAWICQQTTFKYLKDEVIYKDRLSVRTLDFYSIYK